MFEHMHYTESEQKKLLNSMTILVDTREHEGKNDHILGKFDEKKIPWKKFKLDAGDYSFMVPANEDLHIPYDLYFDKEIMVERKKDLEEISGNFTKEKTRIKTEFACSPPNKVLLIENSSYEKLVNGEYDTQYNPKSFWGSLFSVWHQFDIPVFFMRDRNYSWQFIYGYFYYYLRNMIK